MKYNPDMEFSLTQTFRKTHTYIDTQLNPNNEFSAEVVSTDRREA